MPVSRPTMPCRRTTRRAARRSELPPIDPAIDPEIEREIRERHLARGEALAPDAYPILDNLSAAFLYQFMLHPTESRPIEYVRVPVDPPAKQADEASRRRYHETVGFIAQWNYAWEAGHLRHDIQDENIPEELAWIRRYQGVNLCLIGDVGLRSGYDIYRPLYHLLPRRMLEQHGLPLLKRGLWPYTVPDVWADRMLPPNVDQRLARAFAAHVWPLLSPGSGVGAFTADDPLRLLAHNLDFWVPHVDAVAADRMRSFPRVQIENEEQQRLLDEARADIPAHLEIHRPLKGGLVWEGEADAWEATQELVARADRDARLRTLIDDIRSGRVEEDFSDRWSYAREDFERKLYGKRVKSVKIAFVELDETTPVHGPHAEVHEDLLWEDFLAFCDPRERRIVVCLRNGITRVGDIAAELGYANHSPVSKALAKIRRRAERLLGD